MYDYMTVIYECFTYTNTLYVSIWSDMGQFCLRSFLLAKSFFNVGSFRI